MSFPWCLYAQGIAVYPDTAHWRSCENLRTSSEGSVQLLCCMGPGPQELGNFSFSATVNGAVNRRERTAPPATRSSLLMDPEPFGGNVQCCLGLAEEFAW